MLSCLSSPFPVFLPVMCLYSNSHVNFVYLFTVPIHQPQGGRQLTPPVSMVLLQDMPVGLGPYHRSGVIAGVR